MRPLAQYNWRAIARNALVTARYRTGRLLLPVRVVGFLALVLVFFAMAAIVIPLRAFALWIAPPGWAGIIGDED